MEEEGFMSRHVPHKTKKGLAVSGRDCSILIVGI
jgi:hypothetical protein